MENKFLEKVANDLYDKFGENNEFSEVIIVTPSNRAKFFLNDYFSKLAKEKTIWTPEYTNLTQLFAKISDMQLFDDQIQKITLIWELYNEYKKIVEGNKESFDEFYFFGEILLKDFDEIDKYLVNTNYIFKNLNEFKAMQDFSFLDEKQIEILKKFMNFNETKLTQDFSKIWNNLREVYENFTAKLKSQKIGYDGLIMREVAENLDKYNDKFTAKKYAFVGFNSFSVAEKLLLNHLKNEGKAIFYWDFCKYLDENGMKKLNEEIKNFNWITDYYENEIARDNNAIQKKSFAPNIEFIEAVNSVSQVGFISKFLENKIEEDETNTIVLCDEKILPAVISSIPENIKNEDINIAILASASQSQIANLLISKMKESTAQNPQKLLEELLEFIKPKEGKKHNDFEISAISQIKKMLNKLTDIVDFFDKNESLIRIIRQILFAIKIPYSGNETAKLQIMAISDTRNIDFDNILMLSVNEGVLPKPAAGNSFIPQSIRRAFGLPVMQMQDFTEHYNFFRLIQRAKNVSFVYNTGKSGISKGEKSRFLMQLEYDTRFTKIDKIKLNSNKIEHDDTASEKIEIPKDTWILDKLKEKYKNKETSLSPSAFNLYSDCPLQFYFKYVVEIRKPDEEKELNSAALGNIFHKVMELIYKNEKEINCDFFDKLDKSKIDELIEKAFEQKGFGKDFKTGEGMIISKVVSKMLKSMLQYDKEHAPFEIVGLEDPYYFEKGGMYIGGIIDRIDKKGDEIRIVDYKTGGRTKIANYEFQTYLYSKALATKFDEEKIASELIFVLENPIKTEPNKSEKKDEYETKFNTKLKELFDEDTPFKQCEDEKKCEYCDYSKICGR